MELTQKQALFMMNYAQYATYKVRTYNNIAVLEDEYKNLKDNMNLEIIKDESSVYTINRLMNLIHEERKNNKNRERLQASLERKMNHALYDSFQQLPSVLVGTGVNFGSPMALTALAGPMLNVLQSAGMMYMNYRKYKNNLSEEYDEKMWEYQQLTEDELNDVYEELNTYTHRLIQQYGISDEWRLNEHELVKLFDFLKDDDAKRKFTNLKNLSTDRFYSHFPLFWYHLAQVALEIGKEKDALEFYARFEEENIQIFRYDTIAVDAYKGKISILLKDQEANLEEIKAKLKFIEANKTSWNDYYFCALVYANIGDAESARRILERNINELASAVDSDLMDKDSLVKIYTSNYELDGGSKVPKEDMYYSYYQSDAAKRPARVPYNTLYDGLELSRSLLQKIGSEEVVLESIQKQYKQNTASLNESLYLFGKTSANAVAVNSVSDIKKIKVSLENMSDKTSCVSCQIPLQWMLSSSTKLSAVFKDKAGEIVELPLELDEKAMKKLKGNKISECSLIYTTGNVITNWKRSGLVFAGVKLCHPIYPLSLRFSVEMTKAYKDMIADSFEFGGKEFKVEKSVQNESSFSFGSIKRTVVSSVNGERLTVAIDELLNSLGDKAENTTSEDLLKIVKFHAIGAAASSAAAGLIPGAGGTAASACFIGFVWAMYVRLSKKIGIPFEKNILKALASAVVTNLIGYAITILVATSVVSLIPGLGSVAASAVDASLGYAVVYVSGIIYMNLLAKLVKDKKNISEMSEKEIKEMATETAKEADVKSMLKDAQKAYKSAKDEKIEIDESDAAEFEEGDK